MSEDDPGLARWALEQRESRQQSDSHEAYLIGFRPEALVEEGAGGVRFKSSDNQLGEKELTLDVRPVLLGRVEVCATLSTRAPGAAKPHSKRLFMTASPKALRDLARQLLETADAAERRKLKPKPVL